MRTFLKCILKIKDILNLGFVYLANHGLNPGTVSRSMQSSKTFFLQVLKRDLFQVFINTVGENTQNVILFFIYYCSFLNIAIAILNFSSLLHYPYSYHSSNFAICFRSKSLCFFYIDLITKFFFLHYFSYLYNFRMKNKRLNSKEKLIQVKTKIYIELYIEYVLQYNSQSFIF